MIELKKVSKKFGETRALENISFSVKSGEIIGLLGPNGAGKTTTLRLIAGVLPPSSGQIFIENKELKNSSQKLKKLIGYLPERNPLYDEMTVEEFLRFWAEIKGLLGNTKKRAIDFVVKHTGIAEVFYRPISEISKGYRQRVGLSQAILTKPDILLLDEPTEGLDPNQRKEIKKLIKSLGKNRTIIISSHVLSEVAQIADRVIIIHKGKIVGDDTVLNLKKSSSGNAIIEVEVRGSGVVSGLKKLSGVKSVKNTKKDYYVVEVQGQEDIRENIFKTAVKQRWLILTMFLVETQLEDVFAQLTKK